MVRFFAGWLLTTNNTFVEKTGSTVVNDSVVKKHLQSVASDKFFLGVQYLDLSLASYSCVPIYLCDYYFPNGPETELVFVPILSKL